jgi:thioredoxin-related protein
MMKNNVYFILVMYFSLMLQSVTGETKVRVYLHDAAREAMKERKILVIEFWSPSCNPCMGMKRDIFENKIQAEFVHKYFHLIQVSPADSICKPLWKYFHLEYESSVVYLDNKGKEIDRTVGYNGDRDGYLSLMKDVTLGKNLYRDVVRKYRRDTSNVLNCCLMARKFESRYEYDKATTLYERILKSDSPDKNGLQAECMFKIAEMEYILTGSLKKMLAFVGRGSKNSFGPRAYLYLINDLISKKEKAECLSICETGYRSYPESWEILNKYAWALYTFKVQEEYPKALSMVQKSISINPSRPGTYSTEAWIHFEMGNKEKAIQLQMRAIDIFPDRGFIQDLETFKRK